MSDFNVKFKGVRGSYTVADKRFLEYGGNTACVEVNVGGHVIILDAGTGIINSGYELVQNHIMSAVSSDERKPINASVFLSHIHLDHIQGLTFFNPIHLKSANINIFSAVDGKTSLADELERNLFGKTFPLDLGDVAANLQIKNINPDEFIVFKPEKLPVITSNVEDIEPNDVVVSHFKSYSHPKDGVNIYKIFYKGKSLVYATDKESYCGGDKKLIDFAKDCDLLIHDSQYTSEDYLDKLSPKQGYGHSTFDMAVEMQKLTNAGKMVCFHYDPNYDDNKLNFIKEQYKNIFQDKILMSYEGLTIDL